MPIVEIDAALVGDSTLGAMANMFLVGASTMAGNSSVAAGSNMFLAGASTMVGNSSAGPAGTMAYRGISSMVGGSVITASAGEFDTDTLALGGTSTFSITAALRGALGLTLLGNSSMMFNPAGVTIVNFSRGPQIPATAKPVTIPTIRIVPPGPPAPNYSVGSPVRRNRRREGL